MKVAYVCYWNLLEKDGVAHKIDSQVLEWRRGGAEVDVFCLSAQPRLEQQVESHWSLFPFKTLVGRVASTVKLQRAVAAFAPDVVYLRYDLFLPPLGSLLSRFPAAVELNSDDRQEIRQRKRRPRSASIYNEFNRRSILSRAGGFLCVTHELASSPLFTVYQKPTIVVSNGVDLDALTPLPVRGGKRARAVFLGSRNQFWHGVDKIIVLAEEMPEMDFDLIGYDPADLPAELPENITVHGILARSEYEPIVARADLAIGTLALHRKQMEEACPLKVREYLGYGLPVVIAYEDTDFMGEDPWYILRLPNTESNVRDSVPTIRAFVERVRGRRVPRGEIEERVGTHAKEVRRLEFLRELSNGSAGRQRRYSASNASP
jgi:glycosyltransferase involved in cell wall biosynthesis